MCVFRYERCVVSQNRKKRWTGIKKKLNGCPTSIQKNAAKVVELHFFCVQRTYGILKYLPTYFCELKNKLV